MTQNIVAYIPVLHQGYYDFLTRYPEINFIYILGEELIGEYYPRKEIRALSPNQIADAIASWKILSSDRILVANLNTMIKLKSGNVTVIMPDEDICHKLYNKHLQGCPVKFSSVFLRWDENAVKKIAPPKCDRHSNSPVDLEFMRIARSGALKSSDWWRRVGALLVKNGEILLQGHNRHLPLDHSPYINGDPRDVIEAGKDSHIATAVHAEQEIIAEAAANGVSTEGTDIYVSVFPCPMCARLIALSGIKKCFFASGHASLDGERILKLFGVEIIWVETPQDNPL